MWGLEKPEKGFGGRGLYGAECPLRGAGGGGAQQEELQGTTLEVDNHQSLGTSN